MTDALPQRLDPLAIPLVNKFYANVGARGRATKQDLVWVVRCEHNIVAAARIVKVEEHALLCGVYVAADYRGKGVASAMVAHACREFAAPLYSFIYTHLERFYSRLGFSCAAQTLPSCLQVRLRAYQQQGRKIVPVCYGVTHG